MARFLTASRLATGSIFALFFATACKKSVSDATLKVDPGEEIYVSVGPNMLGAVAQIKSFTVSSMAGVAVPGRATISNNKGRFQYARSHHGSFDEIIETQLTVPEIGVLKLHTFAGLDPLYVDFATEKTVSFFQKLLKRSPTSPDEADRVYQAIAKAMSESCLKGHTLPGVYESLRAANNAMSTSEDVTALLDKYEVTPLDRQTFVEPNQPPKVLSGVPFPSIFGVTEFSVRENTDVNIAVNIFDADKDLVTSDWLIDGKALTPEDPFVATRESDPVVPESFWLLKSLRFQTTYDQSQPDSPAYNFNATLRLCDGGKEVLYRYKIYVDDTNRNPVFTAYPVNDIELKPGVVTMLDLEAQDEDGDKITFGLSPAATENVQFVRSSSYFEDRKLQGLYIFAQKNRDKSLANFDDRTTDPWFERNRSKNIRLPTRLEFVPAAAPNPAKVRVYGLDAANPTTYQESEVVFDESVNPITGDAETLRFVIQSIDLKTPINLNDAKLYCVASSNGFGFSLKLDVACDMDRFPGDFKSDTMWALSMRCPDAIADATEMSTISNPRCDNREGDYISPPGAGKTSKAHIRVAVRPERFQVALKDIYEIFVAYDGRGGAATAQTHFFFRDLPAPTPPNWTKLTVFEHFKRLTAGLFSRELSPNFVSYALKTPFARDPNYIARGEEEIYGSAVKLGQRAPLTYRKPNWWQEVRWDQVEAVGPSISIFDQKPFIRFLTATPQQPDPKLIISTAKTSPFEPFKSLPTTVNPWVPDLPNMDQANIFKYEVIESFANHFAFKVLHGLGYGQHLYCVANMNFDRSAWGLPNAPDPVNDEPIDSDWIMSCGSTLADARVAAPSYHYSFGPQGLANSDAMNPEPNAQVLPDPPAWSQVSCVTGKGTGPSLSGQSCVKDASIATLTQRLATMRFFEITTQQWVYSPSWYASSTGTEYDPYASDPVVYQRVLLPNVAAPAANPTTNTDGAAIYPKTRRLILPQSFGTTYRWCRYGLRARMTALAMTCSKTDPGAAANYPTLYSYHLADSDLVTLEFTSNTRIIADDGFPRFKTYLGALNENPADALFRDPSAPDASGLQRIEDHTLPQNADGTYQLFRVPSLKMALTVVKVAYDNTAWEIPRVENRPERPVIAGYQVMRRVLGAGGATTWVDATADEKLSIFVQNPNKNKNYGDPTPWDDPANGDISVDALGATQLRANEFIVAWRPSSPAEYEVTLHLQQGSDPAARRDLTFSYDVAQYVYPPSITLVDAGGSNGRYDPPSVASSINRQTLSLPDIINQKAVISNPSMYLFVPGTLQKYMINEFSPSQLKTTVRVDAELNSISVFWLRDESGNLVDPLELRSDGRAWHEVWPFRMNDNPGNWSLGDIIRSQAGILSLRDGTNGPYEPGASDTLQPAAAANLINAVATLGAKSTANLSSIGDGGGRLFVVSYGSGAYPYQEPLNLVLNNISYPVSVIAVPGSGSSDAAAAPSDLLITGLNVNSDLSAYDPAAQAACRVLMIYPASVLKAQSAVTRAKIFCSDGATFSSVEPVDAFTDVTTSGVALAFESNFASPVLDPANGDHTFTQSPLNDITHDTVHNTFAIQTGDIAWGQPGTGLKASESTSRFRAVLVVTDSVNVIYQPVEFVARSQDRSFAQQLPAVLAPPTPECAGSYTVNQPISPALGPLVQCYLPKYLTSEGVDIYSSQVLSNPGDPADIGVAFTRESTHPVQAELEQRYHVSTASWPGYPAADTTKEPVFDRVLTATGYRWRFTWQVPGLAPADLQDRFVNFTFVPGAEFPRKLFAQGLFGDIFSAKSARMISTAPIPRIHDSNIDRNWIADITAPSSWPVRIRLDLREPNRQPCLLPPSTSPLPSSGQDCPTSLAAMAAAIDSASNVSVVDYSTPSPPNGNDLTTPYYLKLRYDNVPTATGWTSAIEGDQLEIPLMAYDQNNSKSPQQTLNTWYRILGPSSANPISDAFNPSTPYLRTGKLRYTPQDKDLPKADANGDLINVKLGISDLGTSSSNSPDAIEEFLIKVWDRNYAPQITLPTGLLHTGGGATRSFTISTTDSDSGDRVKVEFIGTNVPQLNSSVVIGSPTASGSSYKTTISFTDIPDLATVGEVEFFFRVSDVPWWSSNGNGIGTAYYSNHPGYRAAYGDNPLLDPVSQTVRITTSLQSTPRILGGGATRPVRTVLNQTYVEPIVVFNPLNQPVTCSVSKNQSLQVPNPAYVPPIPPNQPSQPQYIAATDIAKIENPNIASATEPLRYTLPESTACVVTWRPVNSGWVSATADARRFRISVKVGSTTLTEDIWFEIQTSGTPGNLAQNRPPLLGVTMTADRAASFTSPSGVPEYTLSEGSAINFSLNDPYDGVGQKQYIWYFDKVPLTAGVKTLKYSPKSLDSGTHEIAVFMREGSVYPSSQPSIDSESGYNIFRAIVYVRNTEPAATLVKHPSNAARYLHFLNLETRPAVKYSPFGLFPIFGGNVMGTLDRIITDPTTQGPLRRAFRLNFDLSPVGTPDPRFTLDAEVTFDTDAASLELFAPGTSSAEAYVRYGRRAGLATQQSLSSWRFSANKFLTIQSADLKDIERNSDDSFRHKKMESAGFYNASNVLEVAQVELDGSPGTSITIKRQSNGATLATPAWASEFDFYKGAYRVGTSGPASKTLLIHAQRQDRAPGNYGFYLIPDPENGASGTSIELSSIVDPATETMLGGGIWTAPCLANCSASEVEFAALVMYGVSTQKLVFGILDTSNGSTRAADLGPAKSIVVPPLPITGFVGGDPIRHLGHLFPTYIKNSSNLIRHGNASFIIVAPGTSRYLSFDLINLKVSEFGAPGAEFGSLSCVDTDHLCYLGDAGNKGVWRLK